MKLSNRLNTIHDLIPENSNGIVDVGTDHGYIPVKIALERKDDDINILATDINEMPLNKAISYAKENYVFEKIEFFLCNGLEKVNKDKVDNIIIAGMGGENITSIIDNDYWCASPKYNLILQPMTQSNILRYWLINNSFRIDKEILVKDNNIIYQIITARYGEYEKYNEAELFTGKLEKVYKNKLFPEYLDSLIKTRKNIISGLENSNKDSESYKEFNRKILKELIEMKNNIIITETK